MADPLDALRSLMASHSPPLDALIVPSEDNHQSEYVSARDKRREFVSKFSGSAVHRRTAMRAAIAFLLCICSMCISVPKMMKNIPSEGAIGIDPWCVSVETAQRWERAFTRNKQTLIQLSTNLVDEVWKDRPPAEELPVVVHPLEFTGRSVEDKLKDLREKLMQEKAFGIIITALDEVAWLYNVRGNDVAYSPVVHAYAIVTIDSAFFYVDKRKVNPEVQSYMSNNGIEVREYKVVESDASLLASGKLSCSGARKEACDEAQKTRENGKIWIDPVSCCLALYSKLASDRVIMQQSPLALAKAIKAHIRDGAAVVQYLVWLDGQMQEIYGASGYFIEPEGTLKRKYSETRKLTEVTVSDKLEGFRAKQENFKGLSFPTISSVGPNAAIIHYSPDSKTCSELDADSIYLFDSGAQYQDGTTDITRTVHFGKPSAHEKACYTAVLKGHIALDTARFPNGTSGHALDILARIPLWKDGLDYRHGTGHGIGSYLNVHEGPHLISFRPHARNVPLQASMTVTDEPGYYEDGNFGIRLENVLIVKEANTKFNFGDKGYLTFEHITWAPYQKKLMDLKLMTPEEREWVNSYHANCRSILAPLLNELEMEWLTKATEPIAITA
ncbi:uncharacterized protein A4U43_C08F11980 [Asparagus officinalis]|nr:uncharacterized protein A4U43_C08F11980 [Asparagus officinalis]